MKTLPKMLESPRCGKGELDLIAGSRERCRNPRSGVDLVRGQNEMHKWCSLNIETDISKVSV